MKKQKKILIAAGGTGGHLFPAQALADELLQEGQEIFFAGAGLKTNRYFQQEKYPFQEVAGATVFKKNVKLVVKAIFSLLKGIKQSLNVLSQVQPDLVVGFGSFHSFPLLVAARLKRIPLVLFESNAIPGKVNRLFSRWTHLNAVHFSLASQYLKGNTVEVEMPVRKKEQAVSEEEARGYFSLKPSIPTLLVFGGSQGASAINVFFLETAQKLSQEGHVFQVIHILGKHGVVEPIIQRYQEMGVPASVKAFESRMDLAYQAATLAIARSGAATLSELIAFEIPSILIPFPFATDDHQKKNAEFLEYEVKGAVHFRESELSVERLYKELSFVFDSSDLKHQQMKTSLSQFKSNKKKADLCTLICETVNLI